jgi:hypothetical protein
VTAFDVTDDNETETSPGGISTGGVKLHQIPPTKSVNIVQVNVAAPAVPATASTTTTSTIAAVHTGVMPILVKTEAPKCGYTWDRCGGGEQQCTSTYIAYMSSLCL